MFKRKQIKTMTPLPGSRYEVVFEDGSRKYFRYNDAKDMNEKSWRIARKHGFTSERWKKILEEHNNNV